MMFRYAILLTNEYLSQSSHFYHLAKKLSQSSRCFARGIYEWFGLSEYIRHQHPDLLSCFVMRTRVVWYLSANHTAELNSDSTRAQTRKFSANINFSGSYWIRRQPICALNCPHNERTRLLRDTPLCSWPWTWSTALLPRKNSIKNFWMLFGREGHIPQRFHLQERQ